VAGAEVKKLVEFGRIEINIVTGVASWPMSGVKVYIPDTEVEIVDGDQVPVIPFVEMVGSDGAVVPEQKGPY